MKSEFDAPDIVCDGCASAIRKALARLEGVSEVAVDVQAKHVVVRHEPTVTRDAIAAALDRAGFAV